MRLTTDNGQILCETAIVYGRSEYIGIHALASVMNSLTAAGAVDIGVKVRITYPIRSDRVRIYAMEKVVKKECRRRGAELLKSRIFENPLVVVPSVTIDGIAALNGESIENGSGVCKKNVGAEREGLVDFADKEIVLSKWVGMDGMLQAARERTDMLKERFTPAFIRQILSYEKELFAGKELEIAWDMGVLHLCQITQGGIFSALWDISKELRVGLNLDIRRFSILQETVEVCEYYGLNPYQLTSTGSFLFVTEDGEALKEALLKEGIMAAVIGRTTSGQDKIIRNEDDVRYIDRPAPDEIWKLHVLEK